MAVFPSIFYTFLLTFSALCNVSFRFSVFLPLNVCSMSFASRCQCPGKTDSYHEKKESQICRCTCIGFQVDGRCKLNQVTEFNPLNNVCRLRNVVFMNNSTPILLKIFHYYISLGWRSILPPKVLKRSGKENKAKTTAATFDTPTLFVEDSNPCIDIAIQRQKATEVFLFLYKTNKSKRNKRVQLFF